MNIIPNIYRMALHIINIIIMSVIIILGKIINGSDSVKDIHCSYLTSIIEEELYDIILGDKGAYKEIITSFVLINTSHLVLFPRMREHVINDVTASSIRKIGWRIKAST